MNILVTNDMTFTVESHIRHKFTLGFVIFNIFLCLPHIIVFLSVLPVLSHCKPFLVSLVNINLFNYN